MKSKKNIVKLVSITLIVFVLIGLMFYGGLFDRSETENPLRQKANTSSVLPVKAMIMKLAPLTDKLVAGGSIMADEQVMIAAEVPGRIEKIHFSEGTIVKKGDLLFTINNADLFAQIDRNRHLLDLAKQREVRQRTLLKKQGISQQSYDQALTELSTLQAEAALLQAQLDKTLLKAPFDGQLGLRKVSEGSYVSPGMQLVSLAKLQPVKIEFSVPERYTPYVERGTPIVFSVENQSGEFEAQVYALEP
ncbi:MAG: efflux RND transporter periplasmic adaptor subunit, partial [Bacteroidales bacterium]|nr:efflux RND transporter periplasmic adaptor subunit [Bacteroidales bacterium]